MIKVVSWNVGKREEPWQELVRMARDGDADLALLQEAGSPPGKLVRLVDYEDRVFWDRHLYDRWPLVVKLSERITVRPYQQVPPIQRTRGGCSRRQRYRYHRRCEGDPARQGGRVIRCRLDVRSLVEASSVYQEQVECRLLGCLGTSDHFRLVGVHRPLQSDEASDPGCGRSEHVLRGDRFEVVTAGT